MINLFKKIPITASLLLMISQIISLLPFLLLTSNSKSLLFFEAYSVKDVVFYFPALLFSLSFSFLLIAVVSLFTRLGGIKAYLAGLTLLAVPHLLMLLAVLYYIYFGGYPGLGLIQDFINSPTSC